MGLFIQCCKQKLYCLTDQGHVQAILLLVHLQHSRKLPAGLCTLTEADASADLHSNWAALCASLLSEYLLYAKLSLRHCIRPLSEYTQARLTVGGADLLFAQVCISD